MSGKRRYLRTLEDIWEDGLLSRAGLMGPDPYQSWRHQAMADVLRSIPEDDYEKLEAAADFFQWFIPDSEIRGAVYPFAATVFPEPEISGFQLTPYAQVIYLSPLLEQAAWDIAVGIVAHELAHIVLNHNLFPGAEEDAQEEAAWQRVSEWGFEREAKKVKAVHKWRESWQKYQVRKLIEKRGTE